MKPVLPLHLATGALAFALACSAGLAADAIRPVGKLPLINERGLAGWEAYGQDGDPAAASTWSIRDGVLAATGTPNGYLRTRQSFRDYTLRVEWRWVPGTPPLDAKGQPRTRNSGVLLHMHGEDKVWPACLEAQLMESNAGDFIAMGDIVFAELVAAREAAAAAAGADEAAREKALTSRRLPRTQESSEKPVGEWNVYEIVCRGDTVSLTVNGVLQNTATGVSVSEGRICLQSEGVPIEFRRIELTPVEIIIPAE